jgi:hypothetical protein
MGFYEYFFGEDKPEDDLEKTQKGMGYGELILDNVVGLDNEYDSFGEKLGRYINEDEIGFLKETGRGMYEGAKDFVQAPIETTKEAVRDVVDSTKALFTQDLDDRLMDMYGVDITNATGDQINAARESILGDALNASSLIPAAGAGAMGVRTLAKAMPEYDPTMVGSNLGNVFATAKDAANQTEEMLDIDRRVDTRLPTTPEEKGGDAGQIGTGTMVSDTEALMRGNSAMAQNFAMMAENYPGLRNLWSEDVTQTAQNVISRMTDNIVSLYDMSDRLGIAKDSANWYRGANRIALGLSDRFGISDTKTAGVLAALSPGKDWYQNVGMGERIIKHNAELGNNAPWTPEMDAIATTEKKGGSKGGTAWQKQKEFETVRGRPWGEMETPLQKAMWIRAYDEAHFGTNFREVSPEGDILGVVATKSGAPSKLVHQSFDNMAKAIRILDGDGTLESISPELGGAHKVRNFFNNILNPDSPKDVTVDTHQIAAGLFRPLGQNSNEVNQGLTGASATGNPARWSNLGKAETGMRGSYGLYFDATTEAAKLRNVLPREMQSVSWEQLRTLFPKEMKNNKNFISSVDAIWRMVDDGTLDANGAREMIIAEAEKVGAGGVPSWKNYIGDRRDIGIATAGLIGSAGLVSAEEQPEEGFATPQ